MRSAIGTKRTCPGHAPMSAFEGARAWHFCIGPPEYAVEVMGGAAARCQLATIRSRSRFTARAAYISFCQLAPVAHCSRGFFILKILSCGLWPIVTRGRSPDRQDGSLACLSSGFLPSTQAVSRDQRCCLPQAGHCSTNLKPPSESNLIFSVTNPVETGFPVCRQRIKMRGIADPTGLGCVFPMHKRGERFRVKKSRAVRKAVTSIQPGGNHRAAASAVFSGTVLKAMAAAGAALWTALMTASKSVSR
jgi:hypothetical protein